MEHLHHFGLSQDPFSNEPDLRIFFESESHRNAQRRVERGLRQQKGLTLLTGEGGMGKTLLARRILEGLEEEVFEAMLLVMMPGAADATGILQRFARQLGTDEPSSDRPVLLGQIYEQLAIVREDGRHAILIVDDAQIMSPEVFAEFGGLLNLEYEDRRLVSMLLVGSPELDRLVQNDSSLMPRIDVRVRLQPLDMKDATAYLAHRLKGVGGDSSIVPAAAIDALHKFGRGRPRLLNTLADNALFEAYLAGRSVMDPSDVERAAEDLGIGPDPGTTFRPGNAPTMRPQAVSPNETTMPSPESVAAPAAALGMAGSLAMDIEPEKTSEDRTEPVGMRGPELVEDSAAEFLTDGGGTLEPESDWSPDAVGVLDLELEPELAGTEMPGEGCELDGRAMSEEGLEAAFEDFEQAADAVSEAQEIELEPAPEMVLDGIAFEDDGDGLEPLAAIEAEPLGAEEQIGVLLEAEPIEAEMSPLAAGEGDAFDDVFVELIEE